MLPRKARQVKQRPFLDDSNLSEGHVWLLEEDIVNMSAQLKLSRQEFLDKVTY